MTTQLNRAHQVLPLADRRILKDVFASPDAVDVRQLISRALTSESPVEICGSLLKAAKIAPRTSNGMWVHIVAHRTCNRYTDPEVYGRATRIGMQAQVV